MRSLILPVRARGVQDEDGHDSQYNGPLRDVGDHVARGEHMCEGKHELAPADVALAVAHILAHPEPERE
jgi:hypothetical protein